MRKSLARKTNVYQTTTTQEISHPTKLLLAIDLPLAQGMTDARQKLGKTGEDLAVRELTARGYAILDRRYRTRRGEIDIVCEDRGMIVFVEVRTRTTREFGRPEESVNELKRRKVTAMAVDYLARRRMTERPCRFDVVAIESAEYGGREPRITVYENAFDAT
jgi:putative endonuclease